MTDIDDVVARRLEEFDQKLGRVKDAIRDFNEVVASKSVKKDVAISLSGVSKLSLRDKLRIREFGKGFSSLQNRMDAHLKTYTDKWEHLKTEVEEFVEEFGKEST